MNPEFLLKHHDSAQLWDAPTGANPGLTLASAYGQALAVRQLRIQSAPWLCKTAAPR